MKRILVTGGPVHAHLDKVKIITNRFKGGLMCQLAEQLCKYHDAEVFYLCAPDAGAKLPYPRDPITVHKHSGFDSYRQQVLDLAPSMDCVILGAAVANLIPAKPWAGKFPSHDYKPGDIIPIDFKIAPRVIDEVKKVAPKTHLFGYKLLAGVSHEELIRAAYGIVLEAKATAVFANGEENLQKKFAVTKERGVHPMEQKDLAVWIWEMLKDEYYATQVVQGEKLPEAVVNRVHGLISNYQDKFLLTEAGLIFGTVAVRHRTGFITTGRGKRELDSIVDVALVDCEKRTVYAAGAKASLNAPLLGRMFENPAVDYIVHYHEQVLGIPIYRYAPPGTVRDSDRPNATSFNIEEHGCVLLFNKEGRQL